MIEVEDEHAEARFVAARIAALVEEGFSGSEIARLLPDERAVARARGRARPPGHRLPGDRRAALLRARRDQGRDRVPAGDRQPVRRGLAACASRTGRAAGSATRRSRACRRSPTRRGSRSGRRWAAPTRPASAPRRCKAVQVVPDAAPVAAGAGAGAAGRRAASSACSSSSGYLEALEAERTIEAQGRIENLQELVGVAREYLEQAAEPSLSRSCRRSRSTPTRTRIRGDGSLVTLMTLTTRRASSSAPCS